MITFQKYINKQDHVWYDSSNILYSCCDDTHNSMDKTVKIVFKQGRTYVYHNVNATDYNIFKTSPSNGKAFNDFIKKYECERIDDTDLSELENLRKSFEELIENNQETKLKDLMYNIKVNEETGEFTVSLNDRVLFSGIEGNFSILNLFHSLDINHTIERM